MEHNRPSRPTSKAVSQNLQLWVYGTGTYTVTPVAYLCALHPAPTTHPAETSSHHITPKNPNTFNMQLKNLLVAIALAAPALAQDGREGDGTSSVVSAASSASVAVSSASRSASREEDNGSTRISSLTSSIYASASSAAASRSSSLSSALTSAVSATMAVAPITSAASSAAASASSRVSSAVASASTRAYTGAAPAATAGLGMVGAGLLGFAALL